MTHEIDGKRVQLIPLPNLTHAVTWAGMIYAVFSNASDAYEWAIEKNLPRGSVQDIHLALENASKEWK